jgi:cell division protease FtsH
VIWEVAEMIDEEVSRIVRDAQRLADEILRKEIDVLHHLAKELLKYETIDSKDLKIILEGKNLTRPINAKVSNKQKRMVKRRAKNNIVDKKKNNSVVKTEKSEVVKN